MTRVDFETLHTATRGCEVILLVATHGEAALLRQAISDPLSLVLATKDVVVGRLVPLSSVPSTPGGPVGTAPKAEAAGGRRVVLAVSGCDKVNAAHLLTCLLQTMDPGPRLVLQTGIAGALPGARVTLSASTAVTAPAAEGERPDPAAAGASAIATAGVGDVVIATQEAYSDSGSSSPSGWLSARELGWTVAPVDGRESGGVFPIDPRLVGATLRLLSTAAEKGRESPGSAMGAEVPHIIAGPCVTASKVTGLDSEAREVADRWGAMAESMEGAAAAHICALYGVPFLEVRGISNLVGDRDRGSWEVESAVNVASWAARVVVDALDELPLPRAAAVAEARRGTAATRDC
jgi:futalosine hydrolase